jgi:hypothetical protein
VLVRYGKRSDVRDNLKANFSSEGWVPRACITKRKSRSSSVKKDESHPNVKRWIDEYVAALDRRIERARIDEEREH